MKKTPAIMSWSSGKDSAFALHKIRTETELEIVALVSSFNEVFDRVAIHGTRRQIAQAQAKSLGLPLIEVNLPHPCSNEAYDDRMRICMDQLKADDIYDWVFGDLFLQDIRLWREERMQQNGLRAHFPLWGADTTRLSKQMLESGLIAYIVTLDPSKLHEQFCGSLYDKDFLHQLPAGCDPCGEYGEFHTIVSYAPGFSYALDFVKKHTVHRSGFVYTDFVIHTNNA